MAAPQSIGEVLRGGLRLIAHFVRRHKVSFWTAVAGAALFAGAIVASAVVIGRVTDDLIIPVLDGGESSAGKIWPAVAAILGVAIWKAVAITVRRIAAGWLQFRTEADVREELIDHQLRLDLGWYSRQSTGDLLAISDADARQATFVLAPLPFGTGSLLLLAGSLVFVFALDWRLALLTLALLGIIIALDVWGAWVTFVLFQEVQRLRGEVARVAHESFDGALTVKALGREKYETARFQEKSEELRDALAHVGRVWGTFRSVVDALPAVTIVVVLVAGALRVEAGQLSAGQLVTIAYLLSLLSLPVRLVGYVMWDMAGSLVGWERVQSVMSVREFVPHGELAGRRDASGAGLEGERLDFEYEVGIPVLRNVELDIPPGRTVAVVGATGSGKSTLALLMARLWDPSSGRIRLDGRDLRDFARSELSTEVAFVSQEAFLFDDSVTGNITLGLPVPHTDVHRAAELAAAADFIRELGEGYSTHLGERGTSLSGGQRQRVALARALVRRPRLLILDDATSAVDPSVESAILRGLKRAELPSTVIVIAYRQSSITLADEVVFVEDGRIVAHGTHPELLATVPGYAKLLQAYEEDARRRADEVKA